MQFCYLSCAYVKLIFHIFLVQEKPEVIGDVSNERDILTTRLISKFHFVDLAGSERLNRTHNRGERFKGTCLNVLHELQVVCSCNNI